MVTAEPPQADRIVIYNGFMSYSHAADGLLAPLLQAGLQRFAKPWWKRRAIRVFRDESSLSANPHLWSSITQALDQSDWFVLLLSPDAAESPWVNQEIEYWTEHNDPSRILPVVTDGDFDWAGADVTGDAVPPALLGVFSEEPRWVDLRFARAEEDLDLKNPRFSSAVADIASALRGIPKDELESEEVKQHRRTIHTARAAGALLLLLGMAAGFAAIQASENAQEAAAREFAASAIAVLEDNPELATLLALHAIGASEDGTNQPAEVINALWQAASSNRLVDEWDYSGFWHSDLSPDAERFAYFDGPRELVIMDAHTGEPIWTYAKTDTVDFFDFPAFSPDGRVALLIVDSTSFFNPFQTDDTDDQQARVVILDGDTGTPLHTIPYDDCSTIWHPEWSPDGRFMVVSSGGACDRGDGAAWVDVFDTETWDLVTTLGLPDASFALRPRFDDTGALHVSSFQGAISTFEPETFEPRPRTGTTGFADVHPSGDSYLVIHSTTALGGTAFSAWVVDAHSDETRDVLYNGFNAPRMPALTITRDGRLGVVGTESTHSFVYDLETGRLLHRIATGPLVSSSYDPDTGILYTTGDIPGVKLWDMNDTPVGVELSADLGDFVFADDDYRTLNSFVFGPELVGMVTTEEPNSTSVVTQFFDRTTGDLAGDPITGLAVEHALPDGKFVLTDLGAIALGNTASQGRFTTRAVIWNPETEEMTELFACETETDPNTSSRTCVNPEEAPNYRTLVSPDGDTILAYGLELQGQPVDTGHFRAFDAESGEVVASSGPDRKPGDEDPFRAVARFGGSAVVGDSWIYGGHNDSAVAHDLNTGEVLYRLERMVADIEASPNGNLVASVQNLLSVVVTDTSTWDEVATVATDERVLGLAFNTDETRLAISDLRNLRVLDLTTGSVIQQLGLPGVADIHWLDDETIVVGTTSGAFGTISLSTEEFLASTRERLRRSFTPQECETYRIDPCPTLEEMRDG